MRRILTLAFCLFVAFASLSAHAAGEIAAEPSAIAPGQSSTLKWYFNGAKITVSGGTLTPGTLVTGKQTLTVKPKKTTKYLFDVYYHPELSADKQATGTGKLTHVQYTVTVEVLTAMPGLLSYKGTHNWRVNYQTGWKPMTNEGASDDLVWFQAEEDAVERLSVAIVPLKDKTAAQLMDEIRADIPSHYTHYEVVSQAECTQQGLPALTATFTGNDQAHPGTRTQSILKVFVNGERGYVVSARTAASRFSLRRPLLENMVNSFALTGKIIPAAAKSNSDTSSVEGAQTGTKSTLPANKTTLSTSVKESSTSKP